MQTGSTPTEVAREAIRQLAARRMLPTPKNYAQLYAEISGSGSDIDADGASGMLARIAPKLPAKHRGKLQRALAERDWTHAGEALLDLAGGAAGNAALSPTWSELIRATLNGLETRHASLTLARKRESLEHVLSGFSGDAARMHARLSGLVRSWAAEPIEAAAIISAVRDKATAPTARAQSLQPISITNDRQGSSALRDLLAGTLHYGVVERLGYNPALCAEAQVLASRAGDAVTPEALTQLANDLRQFWIRLELAGEGHAQLLNGLAGLVDLVLNNVGELVADDQWLVGQIERVRELLSSPLDAKTIREAEAQFREIIYKQGSLKHSLEQTKAALKDMLALFIDRLGDAVSNTGDYHDRIGQHAERIQKAEDIPQLGQILDQVMSDTRGMQADMLRARDELQDSRRQAQDYEKKIVTLQQELDAVSAMIKEDPLTHILNRRGFHEAWEVEVARCSRQGTALCVALLDVDDFKQLNDNLGHVAGDDALVHLARILRTTLRPSDVVARYGGEEFVILLPGVGMEEATGILVRVQRELTRRFFMYLNARVLITFSAGVTPIQEGESEQAVVERADRALYMAKKAGKNRVIPLAA